MRLIVEKQKQIYKFRLVERYSIEH